MQMYDQAVSLAENLKIGDREMVLVSGPCAVESYQLCHDIATKLKDICLKLGIKYVFKASFDKANRTSGDSFRSIGFTEALQVLQGIKQELDLPILTDIHESGQVKEVADVVDVLQIPAFLCRQTDLLLEAGKSGKAVNIKKGQFMAPEDMKYAVDKVRSTGNQNVCLTERGASFGYHNLVVDMRSLPVMRQVCPVIFDVTHSLQQPGGNQGTSGGRREFAPYLARAAAAAGVDGFFIETHPQPSKALSDGSNMLPLQDMEHFLSMIKQFWELENKLATYSIDKN